MNTPGLKARKAQGAIAGKDILTLFLRTACDLGIGQDSSVIDAAADLAAARYISFLDKLDNWNSQMYSSTKEDSFRRCQLAALFQKYPFSDPAINREANALEKFRRSEWKCRRMNQKFLLRATKFEPPHMQYMRDVIISIIGTEPNMESIYSRCDFGPGSSVGTHGKATSVIRKLACLSVTPAAEPVALAALSRNPHYSEILISEKKGIYGHYQSEHRPSCIHVQHNKITCVPKNAKTDRTIAIEPALNGFIQKGIDLELRSKLKRFGVDLSSQSLNQALARLGSQGRGYATLDLSAASDSMSIMLIKSLLPPAWFSLLNTTRSPSYCLPNGNIERYEKFCSMGNGFCFPLETLIFLAASEYAISRTLIGIEKTRAVYGDDIIVPQESALLLIEVLRDLGFSVNRDKSFIFGDFRESCGADFLLGENVRPLYIKEPIKLDSRCYPLLNSLRSKGFTSAWHFLFQKIPGRWRYLRPYHREDDSAITVPLDVFMTSRHALFNRSTFSWNWRGVVSLPSQDRKPYNESELMMGKLRGDLGHSETFSARFSERTRITVKT